MLFIDAEFVGQKLSKNTLSSSFLIHWTLADRCYLYGVTKKSLKSMKICTTKRNLYRNSFDLNKIIDSKNELFWGSELQYDADFDCLNTRFKSTVLVRLFLIYVCVLQLCNLQIYWFRQNHDFSPITYQFLQITIQWSR